MELSVKCFYIISAGRQENSTTTMFESPRFNATLNRILQVIVLIYQGWSYYVFRKRIGHESHLEY